MTAKFGIQTTALAAMGISLLVSTVSVADAQGDRDSKEISNYVLTEAGLAKYTQASENLGRLGTLPGACDDSEGAKSLADTAARLDAVPQAKAAIHSAGMSSREFVVFSLSLLQNGMAGWALDQPGGKLPPGVQMANVKFMHDHDAALKKLDKQATKDDCGDDRADEAHDADAADEAQEAEE